MFNKKQGKIKKKFGEKGKSKKWIIVLVIILALAFGIVSCTISSVKKGTEMLQTQTEKGEITKRDLIRSIGATGKIVSVKSKDITVDLAGIKVDETKIAVGDVVKSGQELVVFNSDDLNDSLLEAKNNLAKANERNSISIKEAANNIANTQRSGDYQIDSAKESVDNSYSTYEKALSKYNTAINELNDYKNKEKNAKSNYDAAVTTKNNCKTALDSANAYFGAKEAAFAPYKQILTDVINTEKEYENAKNVYDQEMAFYKQIYDVAYTESEDLSNKSAEQQEAYRRVNAAKGACDAAKALNDDAKTQLANVSAEANRTQAEYEDALNKLNNAKLAYDNALQNESAKYSEYTQMQEVRKNQETVANELADGKTSAHSSYEGTKKLYDNTVETQNMAVDSAKNSQRSASLSMDTYAEEKQVESVERSIENTVLVAPFDGVITALNVEEGDTYTTGPVLTIQDCSTYEIEAQISEYDISDIEIGQKVLIKTNATGDEELIGKVKFISPTAIPSSASDVNYIIRVSIDTPNERLRLDMSASLSVIVEEHKDAVTVPYSAIFDDAEGNSFIKVLGEDGVTETEIYVDVIMDSTYYTEIAAEDISEGMSVVIKNADGAMGIDELMNIGIGF